VEQSNIALHAAVHLPFYHFFGAQIQFDLAFLSSFASSVEISSSLAEKQLETVGEVRSHLSKFAVEHRDATNRSGWGKLFPAIL
jgi:hypothetical protein